MKYATIFTAPLLLSISVLAPGYVLTSGYALAQDPVDAQSTSAAETQSAPAPQETVATETPEAQTATTAAPDTPQEPEPAKSEPPAKAMPTPAATPVQSVTPTPTTNTTAATALPSATTKKAPQNKQANFTSDFEGSIQKWAFVYGAEMGSGHARSGTNAIKIEGEASIRTKAPVTESGTLELWVRTSAAITSYKIKVLVNTTLSNDAGWIQVGMVDASNGDTEYHAKRVSIDDPAKKFIRLDIEATNGTLELDDISIDRILLSTALQKNQQIVLDELLSKLREDNTYQMQVEAVRTLGNNYTAQLEVQRQYIEYANGIYSTTSLVLATSERSKMANPLAYVTFKKVIDDMKKVSSPIQKTRLESLVRPFGDITTASLNIVTGGTFNAFAEPFKSIIATTFSKSSYEDADISRDAKKFAEKNGLAIYETADKFLTEVEKELNAVNLLDKDLLAIQNDVDKYRKDLSKHLKDYLIYGGQEKVQENFNRVMSKDDQIRAAAIKNVSDGFTKQAEALQTRSSSNAQLVQFMLKATDNIDQLQEYKERFNQITSAMITYYEKYEHSISPEQNPFSNPDDRKAWELHAQKTRDYIEKSKEAFKKAYL